MSDTSDPEVRQVCPLHEATLLVCDCDCTCEHARHVARGIKGTHHYTDCRLPRLIPRGTVKRR